MNKLRAVGHVLGAVMMTLLISTSARAQATRTWVSGVGDDVNPCSRTAPCKTFAGAISKTAAGGEISVLDPGGYGAVTITKSITIDGGTGAGWGSILAAGFTGVIINAQTTDVVTLRNLSINGATTGVTGIRILAAQTVFIEDSVIFGFKAVSGSDPGVGVADRRSSGGKLFITNTTIRNNGQSGIQMIPSSGSTTINASIDNVRLEGNSNGLTVNAGGHATISNSVVSGNSTYGLYADQSAGNTQLNVESCMVTGNGNGISSGPGGSIVRISNTTVTNNSNGLNFAGGTIVSYQNNKITGNTAGNGPPSSGIGVQ